MDMPSKTNKAPKAIIWFRNNLRIHDNPSLVKAIQESESLLCVYCHEPNETRNGPVFLDRSLFMFPGYAAILGSANS